MLDFYWDKHKESPQQAQDAYANSPSKSDVIVGKVEYNELCDVWVAMVIGEFHDATKYTFETEMRAREFVESRITRLVTSLLAKGDV